MKATEGQPLALTDKSVFDWLFRSYYAPLCLFAGRLTDSPEDAQDIIEELFVKIWQKQLTFIDLGHARAFLYRSARNACLDYCKHGKVVVATHQMLVATSDNVEEDYMTGLIRSEVWGELYRAIENLPAQCNKVITMSFLEGMSIDKIATELNISVQTVRNTKVRGLKGLKENLPKSMFSLLVIWSTLNK